MFFSFRNNKVFEYRKNQLDNMLTYKLKAIAYKKYYLLDWYQNQFDNLPSYNEMLIKFWIPLEDFSAVKEKFFEEKIEEKD